MPWAPCSIFLSIFFCRLLGLRAKELTTAKGRMRLGAMPKGLPSRSVPVLNFEIISSSRVLSLSKTPLAFCWSEIFAGSPVNAKMARTPASLAPSRSLCRAMRLRSRMLMVARTGLPKRCCIIIAAKRALYLSFASGLSVVLKPSTSSCSPSEAMVSMTVRKEAACGGVVSSVTQRPFLSFASSASITFYPRIAI